MAQRYQLRPHYPGSIDEQFFLLEFGGGAGCFFWLENGGQETTIQTTNNPNFKRHPGFRDV